MIYAAGASGERDGVCDRAASGPHSNGTDGVVSSVHHPDEGDTDKEPDYVYVIPPNKNMSILQGVLHLFETAGIPGLHLAIDYFLRSLAQDLQHRFPRGFARNCRVRRPVVRARQQHPNVSIEILLNSEYAQIVVEYGGEGGI